MDSYRSIVGTEQQFRAVQSVTSKFHCSASVVHRFVRSCGVAIVLSMPATLLAADFYVSPSGSSSGAGSQTSPWDLQTALNQPAAVKPGDTIWLRVPAGTASGLETRLATLDPAERDAIVRVTTKVGESITSIARKHGLTAKQLNWYNPKATRLRQGFSRNLSIRLQKGPRYVGGRPHGGDGHREPGLQRTLAKSFRPPEISSR